VSEGRKEGECGEMVGCADEEVLVSKRADYIYPQSRFMNTTGGWPSGVDILGSMLSEPLPVRQ